MPLTLDIPTSTVSMTDVQILSYSFSDIYNPGGPVCTVEFAKGEVVDGKFVPCVVQAVALPGGALLTELAATSTDGDTIYNAVKKKLYNLLVSEGHIGTGTVS